MAKVSAIAFACLLLAACGSSSNPPEPGLGTDQDNGNGKGNGNDNDSNAPQTYAVGGEVSGLDDSLTLSLNDGAPLLIENDGPFTFTEMLEDATPFSVSVLNAPENQRCEVSGAEGTVRGADVSSVRVDCVDLFTVSGILEGLIGDVAVLTLNGQEEIRLESDGMFSFETPLLDGESYIVRIEESPGRRCAVTDGRGRIAGSDIDNVRVVCEPTTRLLGPSVTCPAQGWCLVNRAEPTPRWARMEPSLSPRCLSMGRNSW